MLSALSFSSTNHPLPISTLNFKSRSSPIRCHAAAVASPKTEIKTAYRSLAKRYHPDAYAAAPQGDSQRRSFVEIKDAYETLSDSHARAVYDSSNATSFPAGPAGYRINPTRKWETDQCW